MRGDDGTTGLGDGQRVSKADTRIGAIGDVDELNSNLGVLLGEDLPADVRAVLTRIQHDLFDLGGELCLPGRAVVREAQLARLEDWLAPLQRDLVAARRVHPAGGSRAASLAHVCRTVCRRAERAVVMLEAEVKALGCERGQDDEARVSEAGMDEAGLNGAEVGETGMGSAGVGKAGVGVGEVGIEVEVGGKVGSNEVAVSGPDRVAAGSGLPRRYLNRLSDLLFVLARILNRSAGGHDVLWLNESRRGVARAPGLV